MLPGLRPDTRGAGCGMDGGAFRALHALYCGLQLRRPSSAWVGADSGGIALVVEAPASPGRKDTGNGS